MRQIDEFKILYEKLSNGTLSSGEWTRLCNLLREDESCRVFWSTAQLDEILLEEYCQTESSLKNDDLFPVSVGRFEKKAGVSNIRRNRRITILTLSALVLFLCGFFFFRSGFEKPSVSNIVPKTSNRDDRIGRIVRTANIRWKEPVNSSSERNFVYKNEQLAFDTGIVEILFDEGIHLIVEGPADLTFLDRKRIRLLRGKLGTRVSQQGIGFTIETPLGIVVDQGTEFGLEVDAKGRARVVVFRGNVDVHPQPNTEATALSQTIGQNPIKLNSGEGLLFKSGNAPQPIRTIDSNYFPMAALSRSVPNDSPVVAVRDNIREGGSRKYYEIVPRGFKEDAPAYVDRIHQWNGVTGEGLPDFMIGGDLIRTFNEDKFEEDFELTLTLSNPVHLFVLYDKRLNPPDWLKRDFVKTQYLVGLDEGMTHDFFERLYNEYGLVGEDRKPSSLPHGEKCFTAVGAGKSVDEIFTVWERKSIAIGDVVLGGLDLKKIKSRMDQCFYGIVVLPVENGKNDTDK